MWAPLRALRGRALTGKDKEEAGGRAMTHHRTIPIHARGEIMYTLLRNLANAIEILPPRSDNGRRIWREELNADQDRAAATLWCISMLTEELGGPSTETIMESLFPPPQGKDRRLKQLSVAEWTRRKEMVLR
jgi:hypothetical protein